MPGMCTPQCQTPAPGRFRIGNLKLFKPVVKGNGKLMCRKSTQTSSLFVDFKVFFPVLMLEAVHPSAPGLCS